MRRVTFSTVEKGADSAVGNGVDTVHSDNLSKHHQQTPQDLQLVIAVSSIMLYIEDTPHPKRACFETVWVCQTAWVLAKIQLAHCKYHESATLEMNLITQVCNVKDTKGDEVLPALDLSLIWCHRVDWRFPTEQYSIYPDSQTSYLEHRSSPVLLDWVFGCLALVDLTEA